MTILGLVLVGCLDGGAADKAAADAEGRLVAGDLPAAAAAYDAAYTEHPDSVAIATGAAYTALLRGEIARADRILEGLEPSAGEALAEVKLRRALVALEARNLDRVKQFGMESGLPLGKLLAAEVALADGDRDAAKAQLQEASAGEGKVGATARAYLELLQSADPVLAGMSEVQALWALGERAIAVKSVETLLQGASSGSPDASEQLLLWAGRATAAGEPAIAQSLLDVTIFAQGDLAWRKQATQAIVHCASGQDEACVQLFDRLSADGSVPPRGIADARATAAYLVGEAKPDLARRLVQELDTPAAKRALLEAGADPGGSGLAQGPFASFLEGM